LAGKIHVGTDQGEWVNTGAYIVSAMGPWTLLLPNNVSPAPWLGLRCASNAGHRYYRNMKARGGDYTVFMRPIIFILPTPHIF
jgi:hypothetical protein